MVLVTQTASGRTKINEREYLEIIKNIGRKKDRNYIIATDDREKKDCNQKIQKEQKLLESH